MTNREILAAPGTRLFPDPELTVRSAGDSHPASFFESGRRSVENNRSALAGIGRSFEDYEHILDFGCGCGRILTWLEPLAELGPKLYATDTDCDAVAWVRENLRFAEASVNDPLPPTSYADGQFDLIYNHSVFTHLDEARQDAWLMELRRITRIGAHLLLTVHGEHAFARYETAMVNNGGEAVSERETYSGHGLLFMSDQGWRDRGFADWYGTTYHTTRYIFSHWARWFRIRAYLPQGALGFQDLVVLERVGDGEHHGEYLRQPQSVLRMIAANGRHNPAPEAVGQAEAEIALGKAQRLLASGPDTSSPSRLGILGTVWRLALSRLIANYAVHEREVDEAFVAALRAMLRR
jgi:SAM-dependent methyltransferase